MFWADKTVYEVKEGIKTAGYKDKPMEELKPIVRQYVKELFEGHPPILPRWYVKMRSLVKLGKPGIEALIEILKDKEEGKNMVRMAKDKTLKYSMRIATLYVIKQITDLGKDGSKEYREAYEAIREQVPTLVDILLHDEDAEVRMKVAETLGYIGDNRAVDGLIKALKEDDAMVEKSYSGEYHYGVRVAAAALGEIEDRRAVEPLIESLIKYGIGGALAKIGDRRAVRPIIQRILEEKNETSRRLLIDRLGKLGGRQWISYFRK
jgi:HEAT repeat protein